MLAQPQLAVRNRSSQAETLSLSIDRRVAVRVAQERQVKLLDPRTGRYYAATTLDLSSTGLKIQLPSTLPTLTPGQAVYLTLGHAPLTARTQLLTAKVVWQTSQGARTAGLELLPALQSQLEAA